jgi:hypothetical protein
VRNLGNAPADNASVGFALVDTKIGKTFIVDIGPGGSKVVTWSFDPPSGQKMTLEVTATTTASADSNPRNNHASVALGGRPVIRMRSPK